MKVEKLLAEFYSEQLGPSWSIESVKMKVTNAKAHGVCLKCHHFSIHGSEAEFVLNRSGLVIKVTSPGFFCLECEYSWVTYPGINPSELESEYLRAVIEESNAC